jgi:hypothetical protein
MSSSAKESNNRYKSRLLNFFNRQAIQIGDRLGTTFRNVKVATQWGLQIVLYPIYLMVQAGLSVGKQLGQKIEQSPLLVGSANSDLTQEESLETLTADRPIEGVLKAIDRVSPLEALDINALPLANTRNCSIAQPTERTDLTVDSQTSKTEILGVASLLETKNLVLIARNNQILDILDSQQQEKLKKSITWEIANYYRDRRLLIESQQQFPDRLLHNDSNKILPPVRIFWQTMDWVQQSPVAMAIDLFGESKLPLRYPSIIDLNSDSCRELELQPTGFLATIDRTIADLETRQFIKGNSNEFDLDRNNQTIADPFQIQVLIRAAIEHFFGGQGEKIQLKETIVSEQLVGDDRQQNYLNSIQENSDESGVSSSELERSKSKEDSWLSWEDLFDNSVSTASLPKNPPNTYRDRVRVRGELRLSKRESPLLEGDSPLAKRGLRRDFEGNLRIVPWNVPTPEIQSAAPTQIKTQKSLTNSLELSQKNERQKSLQVRQDRRNNLVKLEKESKQIVIDSSDSDSLSSYHYSSSDLSNEAQRDSWEVKSTTVGYEKHPLEVILGLLDRAILLLENIFVFIWRKVKRLLK